MHRCNHNVYKIEAVEARAIFKQIELTSGCRRIETFYGNILCKFFKVASKQLWTYDSSSTAANCSIHLARESTSWLYCQCTIAFNSSRNPYLSDFLPFIHRISITFSTFYIIGWGFSSKPSAQETQKWCVQIEFGRNIDSMFLSIYQIQWMLNLIEAEWFISEMKNMLAFRPVWMLFWCRVVNLILPAYRLAVGGEKRLPFFCWSVVVWNLMTFYRWKEHSRAGFRLRSEKVQLRRSKFRRILYNRREKKTHDNNKNKFQRPRNVRCCATDHFSINSCTKCRNYIARYL